MSASAVLIGSDRILGRCLQEAISHLGLLHLQWLPSLNDTTRLHDSHLAILFVHHTSGADEQLAKVLRFAQSHPTHPAVVAITEDFQPAQAAALLKQGVIDCLAWPLDIPRLSMLVDYLVWRNNQNNLATTAIIKSRPIRQGSSETLVKWPEDVAERIELLAPQDSTVLIIGETGSGRTQAARLLHARSPRHREPLIVVECASLSPTLLGSEQHGHLMASSSGVEYHLARRLQAAGDGTVLLEDIDLLPLKLQEILLRAIEQRFTETRNSELVPLRARIIATTHRGLELKRRAGQFRDDLFYHLNAVKLSLPCLTEHRELIAPAVEQCVEQASTRSGRSVPEVDQLAMRAMVAYGWPSNLRELRNVVERAVALCSNDFILLDNLPTVVAKSLTVPRVRRRRDGANLESSRQNAEMLAISQALAKNGNNRSKAAADLGISRVTLYKKLHKYGFIQLPDGAG